MPSDRRGSLIRDERGRKLRLNLRQLRSLAPTSLITGNQRTKQRLGRLIAIPTLLSDRRLNARDAYARANRRLRQCRNRCCLVPCNALPQPVILVPPMMILWFGLSVLWGVPLIILAIVAIGCGLSPCFRKLVREFIGV